MLQTTVVATSVTTQKLQATSADIPLLRSLSIFHMVQAVVRLSSNNTQRVSVLFSPTSGQTSTIPKGAWLNGFMTIFTSQSMMVSPVFDSVITMGTIPPSTALDDTLYSDVSANLNPWTAVGSPFMTPVASVVATTLSGLTLTVPAGQTLVSGTVSFIIPFVIPPES